MNTEHEDQPRVIAGKMTGLKTIASRDVAVISIEVPMVDLEQVIARLGAPSSTEDRWVAVARLRDPPTVKIVKDKTRWSETSVTKRAAIMCADPEFQHYVGATTPEEAAAVVRKHCGVASRKEIEGDEKAEAKFRALEQTYHDIRNGMRKTV